MAHNLNFNEITGKYSFYSLKEKAWHSYGQISDKQLNSREVLMQSQLAFPVKMLPNIYRLPSGKEIIADNDFFTYREDTEEILGTHLSSDYHVVQNVDAFSFFDSITNGEGIIYETAGALGKGERIFITAKLPKYIKVGNDDLIEQYLFLTTSHDGTESITIAFTPVRIVCNNTLNAALSNCSNVLKIRHTSNAEQQLKEAHKIMGMVNTLSPMMEQAFNQWAKINVSDKEIQRLIQIALAPNKETLNNIRDGKDEENSTMYKNQCYGAFGYAMMADSQQLETTKGTLFGAYNAITGYFQNVRNYKDDDEKINSLLCEGTAQKKAQVIFNLCTSFAKYGEDALVLN
jgi:phage/plasmid-like protein (TIGR03299 family)